MANSAVLAEDGSYLVIGPRIRIRSCSNPSTGAFPNRPRTLADSGKEIFELNDAPECRLNFGVRDPRGVAR
jgi:hypothetical protein